ncbi:hypothetical protein [Flavobacterium soyangense]|uniref:VRR-NUC domain-containing protein n=1 Tax=Flavobacterium soyangense TaxID=2023265 RepID=A0A930UD17_9FLAO|nr:hypothetical protein [Flavobacterium soyangense]MBF2709957.1 hypothetical protein [Flavobacterium soyangense]
MSGGDTQSFDFNSLEQSKVTKQRYTKHESVKILERLALEKLKIRYPNNPYLPKTIYTDATTNGLTRCVIDYISFNGFQAERINSTGAIKDNRKTSTDVLGNIRTIGSVQFIKSNTQTGTADISSTIKGRSVKIEIKCEATGDNKQSKGQIEYQKQIEAAGGVYLIVRNFNQFYEWFNEFVK